MTLTEVRRTLGRAVIVAAWLSASVGSFCVRGLRAQTPVVRDSAQRAATWKSVWQSFYYRTFDSVVISAKLPRLRESALADGHREVRIWFGGGLGSVQDLYRFVDDRGHVSGELIQYRRVPQVGGSDSSGGRPGETDADFVRSLRGTCSRFSMGSTGRCRKTSRTRACVFAIGAIIMS